MPNNLFMDMLYKSIETQSDIEEDESLSRQEDFGKVIKQILTDLLDAALQKGEKAIS